VYSVSQAAEHNLYSWDKHWEIIEGHLNILKGAGCNLILVLHPKSRLTQYEWLEDKFNCKIHRKTTAEVLPFCSLYVCMGSTTALWAASLGIRVIDLSRMHGRDMPVFDRIPRITKVSSGEEFKTLLLGAFHNGRRLHDDDWYVDFEARSRFLAQPSIGDALLKHI
ncbi:hypothetical protein MYX84_05420, partial [Acidobacteria bacterium AH-259-O06]|nr:hypothetical protein [Acidobacteria bacterium AH-259-O06]